jgi:hypothetical protein
MIRYTLFVLAVIGSAATAVASIAPAERTAIRPTSPSSRKTRHFRSLALSKSKNAPSKIALRNNPFTNHPGAGRQHG